MLKRIVRLSLMAFALVIGVNLSGASVDQDTARLFAENWLSAGSNPIVADGIAREAAATVAVANGGTVLAYGVNFAPKGFVVVAADDRIAPVVSYSADGEFQDDAASPMHALLVADLSNRLAVAEAEAPASAIRAAADLPEYYQGNLAQWNQYLNKGTRAQGTYALNDVRVPSLVKTQWSQNSAGSIPVYYNYYCPTKTTTGFAIVPGDANNAVTGCSVTAVAQILRYYEWPQDRIGQQYGKVTIGYETTGPYARRSVTYYLRGGDDNGGAYEWDKMLYTPGLPSSDPNYQETTDENIKATARLMADVGILNHVTYFQDDKGQTSGNASPSDLMNKLHYLNVAGGDSNGLLGVLADLDAHRPFYVSISCPIPDSDGHAIVGDGYGYMDGRLYVHLNLGWGYANGGNNNAWYNTDEHFNTGDSLWSSSVSWTGAHNFYRQYLQKNESPKGRIISGRVTDANGQPVYGVKASIRKKGASETFLTMLAWDDPVECTEYEAFKGVKVDAHAQIDAAAQSVAGGLASAENGSVLGFGPGFYRNCTDAQGIWAIDKVAAGDYEIVLEKDGYVFLGVTDVTVKSNANQWGLNFIAVPEAIGALEFDSWWIEDGKAYLKFNRAVGAVKADLSKITIGGVALTSANAAISANSDTIVIDLSDLSVSGNLAIAPGFLYYDMNGGYATEKTNRQGNVLIAPVVDGEAEGSSVASKVVAITRDGDFETADSVLSWTVGGDFSGLKASDFQVTVFDSYKGSEGSFEAVAGATLPKAVIGDWDASNGKLTVNVGEGVGFVRVDYIPADLAADAAFVAGEVYRVNNQAPRLLTAEIKTNNDYEDNGYVVLTFNKPVGGKAGAAPSANDFYVLLNRNGGTASKVRVLAITDAAGEVLDGPASVFRVYLDVESIADDVYAPSGVETIEIKPYANSLFDANGNAVAEGCTSGELPLLDFMGFYIANGSIAPDNGSLTIRFSRRVLGNDDTIWDFGMLGNLVNLKLDSEKDGSLYQSTSITTDNVEAYVYYDNGDIEMLSLNGGTDESPTIRHRIDTSFVMLDFLAKGNASVNKTLLDPVYQQLVNDRLPQKVYVFFYDIYDEEGAALGDDNSIGYVELNSQFTPGYQTLVPPMFTNAKGAYTFCVADRGNSQAGTDGYWVSVAATDKDPMVTIKDNLTIVDGTIDPDLEAGVAIGDDMDEGLEYYGIYYRDLDGDGRIDAVDLNFHNPYVETPGGSGRPAELVVGSQALSSFHVYVQKELNDWKGDKTGMDFPNAPEKEYDWETLPQWDEYPLVGGKDHAIRAMVDHGFRKDWTVVPVTGASVVAQNVNLADVSVTGYTGMVSTLRLTLDQSAVLPRTDGDRALLVAYAAPYAYGSSTTYNGIHNSGVNATPLKADDKGNNPGMTDARIARDFSADDEKAGIYWIRPADESRDGKGRLDSIWVCDSFGPVMAWDGAAPVPVSAVAWRATPFVKYGENASADGSLDTYEYLDVVFSEPIAFASDFALSGAGAVTANGSRGASLLDDYTVRFQLFTESSAAATQTSSGDQSQGASTLGKKGTDFSFYGALYPVSSAVEHATRPDAQENVNYSEKMHFTANATGVSPILSSYAVAGNGSIPVLKIVNRTASITTQGGTTFSTTATGTVALLSNGGGFKMGDATAVFGDTCTVAAAANSVPGASFYAGLANLNVVNTTIRNVAGGVTREDSVGILGYDNNLKAPAPNAAVPSANATDTTPANMVMSGPIFNYVKAFAAAQGDYTNHINSNSAVKAVDIKMNFPAGYKLTAVKVRLVDTSLGCFDPMSALAPLADDGAKSGVYLEQNGKALMVSADGLGWSDWQRNEAGMLYRETTLKPLAGVSTDAAISVCVRTSSSFSLGASFFVEIPDDGITFGTYSTVDALANAWGTADGTQGSAFTSGMYRDTNHDLQWAYGEGIAYADDISSYRAPIWDGGNIADVYSFCTSRYLLMENGINTRNVYYAKKGGNLNPDSKQQVGYIRTWGNAYTSSTGNDLNYNVDYEPGDDLWYDIGGTLGVYDAGIDLPITGRADKFPLPYAAQQAGARSAQFRAAAAAVAKNVTDGNISAPSGEPVAIVGLKMEDASRGFGPRYVFSGSLLVEAISKSLASGSYTLTYVADEQTLSFADGAAVAVPAEIGERAILLANDNDAFVVVRRMADIYDADEDNDIQEIVDMPAADAAVDITVATETGRDIQQPQAITGVRVISVGAGAALGKGTLTRTGTKLSWNGGAAVDVAEGGLFSLVAGKQDDYIMVQVSVIGGAASEELMVYSAEVPEITPFRNITGLEIVAMGDMLSQGWYTFSYDGTGSLSFGNGGPVAVPAAQGDLAIVYGDGESAGYSRSFIVVRRTAGTLPTAAVTDRLFVNQTALYKAVVTLQNVSGVTPSHFAALTNDEESGISLWWDADGSGAFSTGDMFVPLLETPVLEGSGDSWTCTMTPDPAFLTAWLASPTDSNADSSNFFVCVKATSDMSFGDQFKVKAVFYDATENEYDYHKFNGSDGVSFAQITSAVVTCTSVTNTIFASTTVSNQNVDADQLVPLTSIAHWGEASGSSMPWVTKVSFDLVGKANFNPATALAPMDGAPATRGLMLYKDANGNGSWDAADTVVNCVVQSEQKGDVFHYTFLLADESCKVPNAVDTKPSLFFVIHTNEDLPFGVQFYGHMDADYITYNTGVGSGASDINTDVLTSTLNTDYMEVGTAEPFSTNGGLVVNAVGKNVSGYQSVKLSNTLNGAYTLSWNGNSVTITDLKHTTTVTLGSGDNSITVTFDPVRFFSEDVLVYSIVGQPVDADGGEVVALGSKLVKLTAGSGCFYTDVDGDGKFTLGTDTVNSGSAEFALADNLSFFDTNENGIWDESEPIFFDTDCAYTLPWMDAVLDTDSIISEGPGGQAVELDADKALDPVAAEQSPAEGDETVSGRTYLYYVDADADANRSYDPLNDVIIARTGNGEPMTALVLVDTDRVVLNPAFEEGSFDVAGKAGAALRAFAAGDYVKMNFTESTEGVYGLNKSLVISANADNAWKDVDMTWEFLAKPGRAIRRFTPESTSADFQTPESALSAIIGLDFANSGAKDVYLNSVKVRFSSVSNFAQEDLNGLAKDSTSGVQLWKDADGNGVFDPYVDTFMPLTSKPVWSQNDGKYVVTLSPASNNFVATPEVDGVSDFFVVVLPSVTANNAQLTNDGDKFTATVLSSDVVVSKTARQTADLVTGTIVIDSKPPQVVEIASESESGLLVSKLTLKFDEQMKRLASSDLSVWNVKDSFTGNEYAVTGFELSSNAKEAVLTLAVAEGLTEGDYSTAPVVVSANFTLESALVDWAGNPAEIKDFLAIDGAAPVIVSAALYDLENAAHSLIADAMVDTMVLKFSEPVLDATFGSSAWTIAGMPMSLQDPGLSIGGITDALNDSYLVFKVAADKILPEDVSGADFAFGGVQTLSDAAKNPMKVTSDFQILDAIKPVLLLAEQKNGKLVQEEDLTYTLPAGTVLELTFAKNVQGNEDDISGITLVGGGKNVSLTDNEDLDAAFNGKFLSFTLVNDITGFDSAEGWYVTVAAENAGVTDKNGNGMAATAPEGVPMYIYTSPVLVAPVQNALYSFKDAEPVLVPQVALNFMAVNATGWTVEVFAMDETGAATGDALASISGTLADIATIDDDPADNVTLDGWYDASMFGYVFQATLTAERGDEVLTAGFYAFNTANVFVPAEQAVAIERTGAVSSHIYQYDSEDGSQHFFLVDGAYTSGKVTVDESKFAEFLGKAPAPTYGRKVALSAADAEGTEKFSFDSDTELVLDWTDAEQAAKLAATDKIRGYVAYTATDSEGNEVVLATAESFTYTLDENFDDAAAKLELTDGAYTALEAPIVWNDPATLYALFTKADMAAYQWRVLPANGTENQPWEKAGDMVEGRTRFGWTMLDGNKILVAGGYNGQLNGLDTAEIYDAATEAWSATGKLNNAAYDVALVALEDGTAVSLGGQNAEGKLDSIELFKDDEWTMAGNLVEKKAMASAIVNGQNIYVIGGYAGGPTYYDTIEVVTVKDGVAISELSAAKLSAPRGSASLFFQADRLVVVGGKNASGAVAGSDAIAMDAEGKLGAVTALSGLKALTGACYVQDENGTIWAIGDKNSTATYFLTSDATEWQAGPELLNAHENGAAICLNDVLLVVGGAATGTTETLAYAEAGALWTANSDLASAADGNRKLFALADFNGSAFAFGGQLGAAYTTVSEKRLAGWSKWIASDDSIWENKLVFDGLSMKEGEAYQLQVRTKNAAEEVSKIFSTLEFTIGNSTEDAPVATLKAFIDGEEVGSGVATLLDEIEFQFSGDENTANFRYVLDGEAFNTTETVLTKSALAAGGHALELYGVSATGVVQQVPATFEWTVSAAAITIGSDDVVDNATVLSDDLFFHVNAEGWTLYRYALDSAVMPETEGVDIATAIELDGLALGEHTLKAWVKNGSIDWDEANTAEISFKVVALAIDPVSTVDVTTSRTFTLTEMGGEVAKFQWILDDAEAVVVDPATATLTLDDLATGAHTLTVAALDGAGNAQTTPAVASIVVSGSEGDVRLLAKLTANATAVDYNSEDVLTFTLTFTDDDNNAIAVAEMPTADQFSVANGTVTKVTYSDNTKCDIEVELQPVVDGETEIVSLQLPAGVVRETTYGHKNLASEEVSVLVYANGDKALVDFSVKFFRDAECSSEITEVELMDNFYAQISVNSMVAVTGADFILTYDNAKFAMAAEELDPAKQVQAPYNAVGEDEEGKEKCMANGEILDEGSIRLGGAVLDNAQAKDGEFVLAVVEFKAIATGEASEEDFVLSAGVNTIGLVGRLPLDNDDKAIAYESGALAVTEEVADLTIAVAPAAIKEGETATLTATLSIPSATDLTVTVTADVADVESQNLFIAAGETTASVQVSIADDKALTGDFTVKFTVESVEAADKTYAAPAAGATADLAVTDVAVEGISFALVNGDGEEITSVKEGEQFFVQAILADGTVADGELVFSFTLDGTAEAGVDYTYANNFVIAAGENEGIEAFTTYADGIVSGTAKTIEVTVNALSIDGIAIDSFAGSGTLTMTVAEGDVLKADLNGDGVIDSKDIMVFLYYYETEDDGSEAWAACDFNQDGILDSKDVMLLLYYYESGDTLRGAATRGELPAINFWLETENGSTYLKVGEEAKVLFQVECDYGFSGAGADLQWDPELLEIVRPFR